MLKADQGHGVIVLDTETQLAGVPTAAWDYRLGNRSALEWVLDQHKEKTPKDPTIREKFNTYRFADYKEKVIDLLARVTTRQRREPSKSSKPCEARTVEQDVWCDVCHWENQPRPLKLPSPVLGDLRPSGFRPARPLTRSRPVPSPEPRAAGQW